MKGDVKKGVFWLLAAGSRNWLTQLAFAMGTPGWAGVPVLDAAGCQKRPNIVTCVKRDLRTDAHSYLPGPSVKNNNKKATAVKNNSKKLQPGRFGQRTVSERIVRASIIFSGTVRRHQLHVCQ